MKKTGIGVGNKHFGAISSIGTFGGVLTSSAKEIPNLAKMKQKDLDLSDLPEVRNWVGATVGKFYRSIKKPLTLRVDADVLAWLKSQGKGYQTRINEILRSAMMKKPGSRRA